MDKATGKDVSDPTTLNNGVVAPRSIASDLRDIAKGAGISLVGYVIFAVLELVFQLLLAHTLGPAKVGIIGLANSIMAIALVLAMFGFENTIVRFIGIYAGRGDQVRTAGVIVTGLRIVGTASLVTSAIIFGLADLLAMRIYDTPALGSILRILALSLPFAAIMSFLLSVTQGLKRMEYRVAIQKLAVPLLQIGGLIVVVFTVGPSTVGVAYAIAVAFIAGALMAAIGVWRLYPLRGQGERPTLVARTMLAFSWPLLLTVIVERIWQETQLQILGAMTASEQVGIYYMGVRITALLTAFLVTFATIFSPIMAELHSRQEQKQLGSLLQTVTKWGFGLCLPVFLFLFIFSEEVMLVLGPQFAAGSGVLRILAVSQLLHVGAGPVGWLLIMSGHPFLSLFNSLLILGINSTLAFLLIPNHGILGAATSFALSMLLVSTLKLIEVYAILHIQPFNLNYLKPIAAGIFSVITTTGFGFIVSDLPLPGRTALSASFLVVMYVSALVFLKLDEDDKVIVDEFRQRLGHVVHSKVVTK